jgi:hypothetical protein
MLLLERRRGSAMRPCQAGSAEGRLRAAQSHWVLTAFLQFAPNDLSSRAPDALLLRGRTESAEGRDARARASGVFAAAGHGEVARWRFGGTREEVVRNVPRIVPGIMGAIRRPASSSKRNLASEQPRHHHGDSPQDRPGGHGYRDTFGWTKVLFRLSAVLHSNPTLSDSAKATIQSKPPNSAPVARPTASRKSLLVRCARASGTDATSFSLCLKKPHGKHNAGVLMQYPQPPLPVRIVRTWGGQWFALLASPGHVG